MAPTFICATTDLGATGAKGLQVGVGRELLNIVVVEDGLNYRAYENSCPHLKMPLEILADHFLDERRENFVCRTHGARFAIQDGYCISGPCQGASLRAVPVRVAEGKVWLVKEDESR